MQASAASTAESLLALSQCLAAGARYGEVRTVKEPLSIASSCDCSPTRLLTAASDAQAIKCLEAICQSEAFLPEMQ
eukprot:scaffold1178_cov282-Prasinococcus_capsulatus_cf.AAC.2